MGKIAAILLAAQLAGSSPAGCAVVEIRTGLPASAPVPVAPLDTTAGASGSSASSLDLPFPDLAAPAPTLPGMAGQSEAPAPLAPSPIAAQPLQADAAPLAAGPQRTPEPARIERIHLGGTIEMEETEGVRSGAKDSSQLLLPDLSELARRVRKTLANGFAPLITQGTDSLDTTGLVLSQLFPDQLLVLTGAFHPPGTPGSDAPGNLRGARAVAALKGRTDVPQVPYAVMNGRVFLASSLAKLDVDFRGGRRGFQSYRGPVGRVEGDSVVWDEGFLRGFERRRSAPRPDAGDSLALGRAEIAYVNRHTPRSYVASVLSRLERGESDAAVFHGVFPSSKGLLARLRALRARGKPIFVQGFSGGGLKAALFPKGIEPFQLLYKLDVLLGRVRGLRALGQALRRDAAGEIARRTDPSLSLDVERGDFYAGPGVSRGFLLYHQDLPLMRASLKAEIARLRRSARGGRKAELIIEGLGNGHIHLGLLDLLAQARRAGINLLITTRVKDAVPDATYEIGRELAKPPVSAALSPLPGRRYLQAASY